MASWFSAHISLESPYGDRLSRPAFHHVALTQSSAGVPWVTIWRQLASHTRWRTHEHHIFQFVDTRELCAMDNLSTNQNEASIGLRSKPEPLTLTLIIGNLIQFPSKLRGGMLRFCCLNIVFASNKECNCEIPWKYEFYGITITFQQKYEHNTSRSSGMIFNSTPISWRK